MRRTAALLAACLACGAAVAQTPSVQAPPPDWMPQIPPGDLTPAQKQASDEFLAARKTPVFGPFVPLLRSPEPMTAARAMGDYLRHKSTLEPRLSEFAILIVAREWTQNLEWQVHQPIASEAGLRPEIVQAVADGRRPPGMAEDEEIVWDSAAELHRTKGVSDATYARALARFGE